MFENQKILILGFARSGYEAAKVLARRGNEVILNDGAQTPMKGHPVFIAQHATATCCRSCLYKWHKIAKNKELSSEEIDYIVDIIMTWIAKKINK